MQIVARKIILLECERSVNGYFSCTGAWSANTRVLYHFNIHPGLEAICEVCHDVCLYYLAHLYSSCYIMIAV